MAILRRHPLAVNESLVIEWDREVGSSTTRFYKGPPGSVLGLIPALRNSANRFRYVQDGKDALANLEAVFDGDTSRPSEEENTIVWDLLGNDDQKGIFDSKSFAAFSDSNKNLLKKAVADFQAGELTYTPAFTGTTEAKATATAWLEMAKTTDSYVNDNWILRKTHTVGALAKLTPPSTPDPFPIPNPPDPPNPPTNATTIILTGVNQLWTTAQLVAGEPLMLKNIRAALLATPAPPAREFYLWSWLKRRPTLSTKAGNKIEIVQEWWQEQWSTLLYDPY